MVQKMAITLSIIIALCTVIMLASANVSSHNISELQNSIDALTNKVNMLVKSSQNYDDSNKMVANLVQLSMIQLTTMQQGSTIWCPRPCVKSGHCILPLPMSCQEIKDKYPSSPSGYYNLASGIVYCHMEDLCNAGGGWTRIAYLNMSDPHEQCPPGFKLYNESGIRACGRAALQQRYCESHNFSSKIRYSQVCGKLIGYQYWSPNGLSSGTSDINSYYVEGVSLTYGSPRKHIWTFITANSENGKNCPCATGSTVTVPSFMGNCYFCESGSPTTPIRKLYPDALWDGKNCSSLETPCCQVSGIPWFHKTLETSTKDDIELRICANFDDEDSPIGFYDIYVK